MKLNLNKLVYLLALMSPVWTIVACSSEKDDTPVDPNPKFKPVVPIELEAAEADVSNSITPFCFDLLANTINVGQRGASTAVSPLSAAMTLGMLANAISTDDRADLLEALNINESQLPWFNSYAKKLLDQLPEMDNFCPMRIANGAWFTTVAPTGIQPPQLTSSYKSILSESFMAHINYADFRQKSTLESINKWARDMTGLPHLLDGLSREKMFVLANAIEFKSTWNYPFDKSLTEKSKFTREDGSEAEVDMMRGLIWSADAFYLGEETDDPSDCPRITLLPYGNMAFKMAVMMPSEGMTVSTLIRQLRDGIWEETIRNHVRTSIETPFIGLPRFSILSDINLVPILQMMGVDNIFNQCHLQGMSIDGSVSVLKQSLSLDVDEEGTIIRVETVTDGDLADVPQAIDQITFDRPFVYVVWEQSTGAILIAGTYMGPDA